MHYYNLQQSVLAVFGLLLLGVPCQCDESVVFNEEFYSLSAEDSSGIPIQFTTFRNKVLLIVNVASECGFTNSHYSELVKLQEIFGETGHFAILAFPCNQFGQQEPGEIGDIVNFVTRVYGAKFPIFNKVSVIGAEASPVWKYLQDQARVSPNWNFWKYLIDHRGYVLDAWGPQTSVVALTTDISVAIEHAKMVSADSSDNTPSYDKTEL